MCTKIYTRALRSEVVVVRIPSRAIPSIVVGCRCHCGLHRPSSHPYPLLSPAAECHFPASRQRRPRSYKYSYSRCPLHHNRRRGVCNSRRRRRRASSARQVGPPITGPRPGPCVGAALRPGPRVGAAPGGEVLRPGAPVGTARCRGY